MIKKLKSLILAAVLPLAMATPVLVPAAVSAVDVCGTNIGSGINDGINGAAGTPGTNNCQEGGIGGSGGILEIARKAVNLLSIIVGVVAVIMIVFGGFKYITSGGDSNNVSSAKNTLIYDIVGLVIVALAQVIVRFVLSNVQG